MDWFDVRSPPPVSKDIGSEALVTNGLIAESGIPWSFKALLDRIVLPAPLSFKNSMTYDFFDDALAGGLKAATAGLNAP